MKKLILATIAAGAITMPAFAQTIVLGPPQFESYSNRGQCVSALAQERNRQRANPDQRGSGYEDLSRSEFNRASLTTTRCELRDGRWVVVFNADGFDD